MTRLFRTTSRRRRTIALAAIVAVLAPAGVALADPDTNIQKPGHIAISRPLGDA